MSLCPRCKKRPKQKHWNAKWCTLCSAELRKRPRTTLTPSQIREVKKRLHKMPRQQISEEVGVSLSNLRRWARDNGLSLSYYNRYKINPTLVKEVCAYYEKHGKRKTQEAFPNIRVRSLVERYKSFKPRQSRWSDAQLIELAKMAGIVSMKAQAKYFNRPLAHEGSITSAWMKRYGFGGGCVNGLSWDLARHFVDQKAKPIQTCFWKQRRKTKKKTIDIQRQVVLWVDMEKHLHPDCPSWLKRSVNALAKFQRWLHNSNNPNRKIQRLIQTREAYA